MECLPVLLDPATKMFAGWLLGDAALLLETTALLKRKHLKAYKVWKCKDKPEVVVHVEPRELELDDCLDDEDDEDDNTDINNEDDDGPGIILDDDTSNDGVGMNGDLSPEANAVFDEWMNTRIKFGDFLFEEAKQLVAHKTTGKVGFRELISKFDTMKYYRDAGSVNYPSITLLARIHFSTMMNSGVQEWVFLTCKHAMGANQARLAMELLEMKGLLCENTDLIRKEVI